MSNKSINFFVDRRGEHNMGSLRDIRKQADKESIHNPCFQDFVPPTDQFGNIIPPWMGYPGPQGYPPEYVASYQSGYIGIAGPTGRTGNTGLRGSVGDKGIYGGLVSQRTQGPTVVGDTGCVGHQGSCRVKNKEQSLWEILIRRLRG